MNNKINFTAYTLPDPPCEKYRCEYYDKCKADLLACESFYTYVLSGRVVSPRKTWNKPMKKYITSAPVPTRAIYNKVLDDRSSVW